MSIITTLRISHAPKFQIKNEIILRVGKTPDFQQYIDMVSRDLTNFFFPQLPSGITHSGQIPKLAISHLDFVFCSLNFSTSCNFPEYQPPNLKTEVV